MQKSSVKKNFFYQIIYELLVILLPFITSPYIARVIGAEGLGKYSFSYTVANYFVLFAMLGLKNYGNRAIAQARDDSEKLNSTFSSIFYIHALISIVVTFIYSGYVYFLEEDRIYAVIQGLFVISAIFDISWCYFGLEKFKITVARNTIIKIASVVMVFALVKTSEDLWKYCAIMAAALLCSQLTLWIPLNKYVHFVKPCISEMIPHLKPLFVLFIPAIAVSLYKYMDKIMIGTMSSKTQLGYYENAEKVINIPMTIIASFGTVMLPKMSNLAVGKNDLESEKYIKLSMEYVMCLAFALAFGLSAVGKVFAPVFWGVLFEPSGYIIMGLSITIPFIAFANVIRTQYLIPKERDKEYLISVISGAIINLIINWLLIPQMGANGAMIGTIVAEVTVCVIQAYTVRKNLPLLLYIKNVLYFMCNGVAMFLIVYSIGNTFGKSVLTLFVQVVTGIIIYGIGSFIYFYYTKNPLLFNSLSKIATKIKKK